jgi:SNF2 family DNA or RNA helicase
MADLSRFKGAIFDESQALKEPTSKRTRAAHKVVGGLSPEGLVMMLTGTPVLNRPAELIQPLLMLGVLSDEPGSRMTSKWFKNRYCWDSASRSYSGATNESELSKFLRATVMVRRTKEQVLTELPAKVRVPQWVQLSAEAKRLFDTLASDIVRQYRATGKWYIQDITALRKAAGEAKALDALTWAVDFLANTDKQLVVFAHHQATQDYLITGLRKAGHTVTHILGSQKDVEAHKAAFQAGDSRVIVCSIKAAGVGHTLTAASDVLMVEQCWTPADHWQAEDRCHRIGQTSSVTAWYLLAEDTVIDDYMFELVAGKAETVNKVTDDESAKADERSTVTQMLDRLSERYAAQDAA